LMILDDLSVGGFRFMGMRNSSKLVAQSTDNPLLVREN
jgi:hypothetical protein